MFTVLSHSFSKATTQIHSGPSPRLAPRFFPCLSQIVAPKVELGQDRVDLQRLRDRLGTVVADGVEAQVQVGQDPIENA